MSNGFIRHKKVEWVFEDKDQLFSYTPRTEGVYALDNYYGDIYIFNGNQWVLYVQNAIKLSKYRHPQPDNWRRYDFIPTYLTSSNLRPGASASLSVSSSYYIPSFSVAFFTDVELCPGNFTANVNAYDDRSFIQYKNMFSSSADIDGNGYVITESVFAKPESGSYSGSFYTIVSMSIV